MDQNKSKQQLLEELTELRQRVTTLEAVEAELRKNRALLQATIDNLPFDFFAIGMDGRYMLQNAASKAHWGDAVGKLPKDAAGNEETLVLWEENNRRAFAGEKVEGDVTLTLNGETRYYHNVIAPIIDAGQTRGILGMNVNITERKRAEERLRDSERTLRAMVDASPEAIGLVDTEETVLIINETAARRLGTTVDEITGRKLYSFVPPEVAANRRKRVAEVVHTGKPVRFEDQRSGRNVENAMHPVLDDQGKVAAVAILAIDRTDHKRAEEALKQAHDELERRVEERTAELATANEELILFRKFAEASGQGFGMGGLDARIEYVNPALSRLFGEDKPEDLIGGSFLSYYPEEWEQRRKDEVIPALERTGHWAGEQAILSRQGQLIPTLHDVFLLRDEKGNPVRRCIAITDITERKQAEDALRQSRDQLKAVYDGMSDGLLIADIETKRFVRANASICRMLGYSKEELLTLSVRDIHPEADLPFVVEQFQALAEGKILVSENVPVLRKDGSVFHAAVSSSLADYDNRHCVAGFFRDSTERKHAEDALRKSEERFRSYYEQGLMGMAVSNRNMQWTDVNDRFCEIFGNSREEILQQKISDFIHPDDLGAFHGSYQQLLSGETNHYTAERRYIWKDGRVIYLNIFVKCFRSAEGTIDHVFALFDDVTERINTQRALQQSEEKHRGLLEACPDAIVMADLNGRILFASRQTAELVGLSDQNDLLGQSVFDYVIADDRHRLAENIPRLVQSGVRRNIEYTVLRQDGTPVPTEISSAINRDATGQPVAIMVVIRDILERKRAEEILRKEHRTLKHLLQSSDHERQTIAYEIHDGLAQQLAGAIMQLQTYFHQKETNPKLAAKAYDAGMTMLQQGHFESRRLIAGVRPLILDESGVVAAVGHLVNEQSRLKRPKVDYHSSVDFDRLAPILENAIYRIAQEGLTNACQHSKSEKVRVSLVQREDRICIEIRDWGIGFDTKSVQENRFGLVGIRQRARLLGGKCSIRSTIGKGTRITVELLVVVRE